MEQKFNWGWKIVILYMGFVSMILFMVYKASSNKVELVTKDYYEQELQYQTQLDKQARTNALPEKPSWQVEGKKVSLRFPKLAEAQTVTGKVHFYCPSDEDKDMTYPFNAEPLQTIAVADGKLKSGTYKMKIDWKEGQSDYYSEGTVKIE